jgi:hypothetical protein
MASITTRFFFFLSYCNLFISQDYFAEAMTNSLSAPNCFFPCPTLLFFTRLNEALVTLPTEGEWKY